MTEFHPTPILVPTDLSSSSAVAVRIARAIAQSDDNVIVAYVGLSHDLIAPAEVWGMDTVAQDDTEEQTMRLQKWITENNFGDVRQEVRSGDPGMEICSLSNELKCRLIIVPSHGRRGFKRILLGSVAERIIRHCDCSVLVLRRSASDDAEARSPEQWLPRKRVVVPVDLSQSTSSAIATALQCVEHPHHLEIVNVVFTLDDAQESGAIAVTEDDLRRNRQEFLKSYLEERGWGSLSYHILFGEPGMTITDYAEDIDSDLIVMPSHGFHGLKRLLLGSTTERVMRHATAPVLVLHRHDAA